MPHDTPGAIASRLATENSLNGTSLLVFTPDNASYSADPDYKVYVFNLGPVQHEVPRGSAGTFYVKACAPGEPYSEPIVLPSVVRDTYFVEQEMKTHSVSGEFMAADIVHPITAHIGAGKTWWSVGANLDDLGVFWTRNNPPKPEEIAAARSKMEATYRKLLNMAASIEAAGRIDDITPLMRVAATYFGEDRAWNKMYKKTEECPGCGEPTKVGIIRHPCGYIFDPDRALLAGMIDGELHANMIKLRNSELMAEAKKKKR